jgi:hypothetical protein
LRSPWHWTPRGKTRESYTPTADGKWWSFNNEELEALTPNKRRDVGHIGRIMETELGEERVGDERCTACQRLDEECWVYSRKGSQQVSRPGDTCARCRLSARAGGCSLSKRVQGRRDPSPPPPPPRQLQPKGGPPPGAGGSGIMV